MVCSFVSVICGACTRPHSCFRSLPDSLHLKYLFFISLSISNSHMMCMCVSYKHKCGTEDICFDFLSFFLSFQPFCLCLYVSVTLSCSLMRFHSLSLLCQPPFCRRANVYFKRCAMYQPPPQRHSTEEKTDTTPAG